MDPDDVAAQIAKAEGVMAVGQEILRRAQSGDNLGAAELAYDAGLMPDAEIDPNDPDFAPVDGIDIDRYARICRAVVDAGTTTDEDLAEVLRGHDVDPSTWTRIAEIWNERVMRSAAVKMRYGKVFVTSD